MNMLMNYKIFEHLRNQKKAKLATKTARKDIWKKAIFKNH